VSTGIDIRKGQQEGWYYLWLLCIDAFARGGEIFFFQKSVDWGKKPPKKIKSFWEKKKPRFDSLCFLRMSLQWHSKGAPLYKRSTGDLYASILLASLAAWPMVFYPCQQQTFSVDLIASLYFSAQWCSMYRTAIRWNCLINRMCRLEVHIIIEVSMCESAWIAWLLYLEPGQSTFTSNRFGSGWRIWSYKRYQSMTFNGSDQRDRQSDIAYQTILLSPQHKRVR